MLLSMLVHLFIHISAVEIQGFEIDLSNYPINVYIKHTDFKNHLLCFFLLISFSFN